MSERQRPARAIDIEKELGALHGRAPDDPARRCSSGSPSSARWRHSRRSSPLAARRARRPRRVAAASAGAIRRAVRLGGRRHRDARQPTPVPSPEDEPDRLQLDRLHRRGRHPLVRGEVRRSRSRTSFFSTTDRGRTRSSATTAAATTSASRSRSTSRASSTAGTISKLDKSLIPNIVNLGAEWADPGYDPGNAYSVPYMWWTTGVGYDTDEDQGDADELQGALGRALEGPHLDARRLAGGLRRWRSSSWATRPTPTDTAQLDEALALLEQQKPLVRTYSDRHDRDDDRRRRLDRPDLGRRPATRSARRTRTSPTTSPRRAASRAPTPIAMFSGAKHPIAAQLFINHLLDAQVSASNTNTSATWAPTRRPRQFIDPAILDDPTINPDQAIVDKLEELLDLPTDVRDEYLKRWQELARLSATGPRRLASPAAGSVGAARRAPRRGSSWLPGGRAWLAGSFFFVPLAFIFIVSLGIADELDRIVLANPSLDNYARAFDPRLPPDVLQLAPLRGADDDPVAGDRLSDRVLDRRYGGRHKVLLLILVMLPFWTSYLIRTYAWMIMLRDNGVVNSLLQAVGLTSEPIILLNTDFSVVLGMTYGFLPFAILPLFVSIDRLDRTWSARRATCTRSGRQAFLHVDAAADDARDHRGGAADVHPGDRRLRDAGPARRGAARRRSRRSSRSCSSTGRDWPYGRGARVHPDGGDADRHARRAADAAPRGRRRMSARAEPAC